METGRALMKGDVPGGSLEAPATSFAAPTGWDGTCTSVNAVEGSRKSSPASVLRGKLFANAPPGRCRLLRILLVLQTQSGH